MDRQRAFSLWLQWVGANSLAEVLGLGSTLAVDFAIMSRIATAGSAWASIVVILLVTASGAIEGIVVGLLQWFVIRRPFPLVTRRSWVIFTVVGAVLAWFLGSLPSTLMDMGAQHAEAAVQEPQASTMLLLAAAMGVFLGFVLGYPQWRVLRRAVHGAWLWIPANGAAWALGMPTIFAAIDFAQRSSSLGGTLSTMAIGLVFAGALVGAVHGLALVWLASQPQMKLRSESIVTS